MNLLLPSDQMSNSQCIYGPQRETILWQKSYCFMSITSLSLTNGYHSISNSSGNCQHSCVIAAKVNYEIRWSGKCHFICISFSSVTFHSSQVYIISSQGLFHFVCYSPQLVFVGLVRSSFWPQKWGNHNRTDKNRSKSVQLRSYTGFSTIFYVFNFYFTYTNYIH
jgi:hypothetical protein